MEPPIATRGRTRKAAPSPGHAVSALDHGILSTLPVLPELEREEDWRAHLRGYLDAFEPVGHAELVFAYRVALTTWRLNRVISYELHTLRPSEDFLKEFEAFRRKVAEEDPEAIVLPIQSFPFTSNVDRIERYESHLHRMFLKDLHELEALQARRKGQPTPLARVEIN